MSMLRKDSIINNFYDDFMQTGGLITLDENTARWIIIKIYKTYFWLNSF